MPVTSLVACFKCSQSSKIILVKRILINYLKNCKSLSLNWLEMESLKTFISSCQYLTNDPSLMCYLYSPIRFKGNKRTIQVLIENPCLDGIWKGLDLTNKLNKVMPNSNYYWHNCINIYLKKCSANSLV